jgi:hypothetical protein
MLLDPVVANILPTLLVTPQNRGILHILLTQVAAAAVVADQSATSENQSSMIHTPAREPVERDTAHQQAAIEGRAKARQAAVEVAGEMTEVVIDRQERSEGRGAFQYFI